MTCPSCKSERVYPSRLRNIYERLRHALTGRRPFRCHACGWRRWRDVLVRADDQRPARPDDLRTGAHPAPVNPSELDTLDPLKVKPR
jgi:hypothetical protein